MFNSPPKSKLVSFASAFKADRLLALEKGCTFLVAAQSAPREPWKEQARELTDLNDAFVLVIHLSAWRTAIFIHRGASRWFYWRSDSPEDVASEVLNVQVLDLNARPIA